jgi:hypothetical protein
MFKLCNAASADRSNLNLGCFGVAQGVLKPVFFMSTRLFGQSYDGCEIMLQMSLYGDFCE